MTVVKDLFGPAAVYTAANIASRAVPFLLLPVLTRVLTPADYGAVAMFSIVVAVANALTGLNVHGVVGIRSLERGRIDLPRYVMSCLIIIMGSTMVVAAVVVVAGSGVESLVQLPRAWILMAIGVSAAQITSNVLLSLWQVGGRPLPYGLFQIGQSATDGVLAVGIVVQLSGGWRGRVAAQAVASVAFASMAIFLLIRGRAAAWPPRRKYVIDALRFGLPLVPHSLGGLAMATMDRAMIAHMLDLGQAGIYAVALQLGMVLNLLVDSFNRAYAPWLYARLQENDAAQLTRIVRGTYAYFLAVTVGAVLLGTAAPALLGVLVGEQFRAAAPVVLYIALGYAFTGMYYMVANYVFFARRTGGLPLVVGAAAVVNLTVNLWWIPAHGAVGAAQSFALAQAVMFAGTWWLAQRAFPMPWLRARALPSRA